MPVRLNMLDALKVGDLMLHPVLCLEQSNEAFYVQLDGPVVREWLLRNNMPQAVGAGEPWL